MTYLQLVNAVLARLRESSVASVTTNVYSTLIGTFVNDAKRQVEDSWDWNCLYTTITVNTVGGTSNYTVTGSGLRPKGVVINDVTNSGEIRNVPRQAIIDWQQRSPSTSGTPSYFAWTGTDGTDSKIELYPTPSGVLVLKVNAFVAQAALSADTDVLTMPSEAIIAGAYARAITERGEDGGLSSGEAYGLYKGILADQIALDAARQVEYDCWVAV